MIEIDRLRKNIPEELQKLHRWVGWKYETRKGIPTKVLWNPFKQCRASSTDSNTWNSFDTCLTAEGYEGVGLVIAEPYVAVDLDHVRADGKTEDWAAAIIEELASYTELSPSGTGYHTWVRGTLPAGRRRVGRVEMYDSARFFTMTGKRIQGYTTLRDVDMKSLHSRLASLDPNAAHKEKEDAANPKPAADLAALLAGDWEGDFDSRSEADLSALTKLCLKHWGVDQEEALEKAVLEKAVAEFEASELMRPKFLEPHYRRPTLKAALAKTRDIMRQRAEDERALEAGAGMAWRKEDKWLATASGLDELRTGTAVDSDGKTYKRAKHKVEEDVYQTVLSFLKNEGEFLKDAYPYLFLREDSRMIALTDSMEAYGVLGRLHLRATQAHAKLILENLQLHAHTYGTETEVGHWGRYDHGRVYINNGRGGMFRVADKIEEVANGTDKVYMHDPKVKPWPKWDGREGEAGIFADGTPLSKYLGGLYESRALSPEDYERMFMARYLSLFFRGAFELLPICFAMGEQGSGKSTTFEKVMWLLEGWGDKVGAMPKDLRGLLGALTNNHTVLWDNVDRTDWEEDNRLDYICSAATGGYVELAKLYETNVTRRYRLRCDQFLTARTNGWPDEATDAGRRTLFFPMRKPQGSEIVTRQGWAEEVGKRDEYLLETLLRVRNCLRGWEANKGKRYPFLSEMPEYEQWTMAVADYEGKAQEMAGLWRGYMADFRGTMTEHSRMVSLLKVWLGSPEKKVGTWVKAGDIFDVLHAYMGRDFTWRSSASFGRALASGMEGLRYALGADKKFLHGCTLYQFNPSPEVLKASKAAFRSQYHLTEEMMGASTRAVDEVMNEVLGGAGGAR